MGLSPHYLAGLGFLAAGLFVGSQAGPQATVGRLTLPSPDWTREDIVYFPAGPEFLLPNAVRGLDGSQPAPLGESANPNNTTP